MSTSPLRAATPDPGGASLTQTEPLTQSQPHPSVSPKRPPRSSRPSLENLATGHSQTSAPADSQLQQHKLLRRAQPSLHGLPTPPHSETTSSVGGSSGRSRKDSEKSAHEERLMLPTQPSVARSPSASSSRTGSDTIGGRSPVGRQGGFESPAESSTRASTFGRRHGASAGVALAAAAAAFDTPERASASPSLPRRVQRAGSSLALRSDRGEADFSTSSNSRRSADDQSGRQTPNAERQRRSALHEMDVSRIRSESRLGRNDEEDEEEGNTTITGSTQHKYSPRKSSAFARSHYSAQDEIIEEPADGAATGARQSPATSFRSLSRASANPRGDEAFDRKSAQTGTPQAHRDYGVARRTVGSNMNPEEVRSASARRRNNASTNSSKTINSSPLSESIPLDANQTLPKQGPSRSPLPLEFRLPDRETRKAWRAAQARDQSDSAASDASEGDEEYPPRVQSKSNDSTTTQQETDRSVVRFPASSSNRQPSAERERSSYRRPRYASDAQAEEVPPMDYDGRLGSQNSRISVDTSSANRYLTKGPLQGTPLTGRRKSLASDLGSPSEEARARKISTSSSRSQKSSGGASDLHRNASRASMRRVHGRDVFDDEGLPPLPSSRSESPSLRSDLSSRGERLRSLRERYGELKQGSAGKQGWLNELEELRSRIEELTVATAGGADARSPSVNAIRTQSALGIHRTPLDSGRFQRGVFTEPRRARHERASTVSELVTGEEGIDAQPAPLRSHSRAGGLYTGRGTSSIDSPTTRMPMTPDAHAPHRLTAGSRAGVVQSSVLPSTARFPSTGHYPNGNRVKSEGSAQTPGGTPAHDRNMHSAFEMFERYFSQAPSSSPAAPVAPGPESVEMTSCFREVVSSASHINAEVRAMIQTALDAQINAELDANRGDTVSAYAAAETFAHLERGLTDVLKRSDEQLRNLTEVMMAITRTERERDRQRKSAFVEQSPSTRPVSRMSSMASPVDEMRRSLETRSTRSNSVRDPPSPADTVTEQSSSERRAERSRVAERLLNSTRAPASPYSPLHAKGGAAGGTLTASQIRNMSSMGHHARSASELSPSSVARRERSMANLSATIKPPPLSPRRPKLSFPSVSNATASFNPSTVAVATSDVEAGAGFSTSPEDVSVSDRRKSALEPGLVLDSEAKDAAIQGSPMTKRHSVSAFQREKPPPRPPRHDRLQRGHSQSDENENGNGNAADPDADFDADAVATPRRASISQSLGRSVRRMVGAGAEAHDAL